MTDHQLLRELHTGLALLKDQQSNINRRLGLIEKALEDEETEEKTERDARDAKRSEWVSWLLQVVGQVALVSALIAIGRAVGVEIAG